MLGAVREAVGRSWQNGPGRVLSVTNVAGGGWLRTKEQRIWRLGPAPCTGCMCLTLMDHAYVPLEVSLPVLHQCMLVIIYNSMHCQARAVWRPLQQNTTWCLKPEVYSSDHLFLVSCRDTLELMLNVRVPFQSLFAVYSEHVCVCFRVANRSRWVSIRMCCS